MKRLIFFLSLALPLSGISQTKLSAYLSPPKINFKGRVPAMVQEDVGRLLSALKVSPANDRANLQLISSHNAPERIKNFLQKDEVSFWLTASGADIKLYANSPQSFTNGLYQLLYEWGFRFYNYTDRYTKKPAQLPVLSIDKGYRPRIRNKEFAGTGGMGIYGYEIPVRFKNRNGYTADWNDPGHLFDGFYPKFQKEIDADKSIMCAEDPRYRLNVDNPKTMQLVKKWVDELMKTNPYVIGAGPSDGMGMSSDCASTKIPEITAGYKYADGHVLTLEEARAVKNWWIANEMAKYIDKQYPNGRTMIDYYAYGDGPHNAAPPHFKLNRRMFVRMIPYAFQQVFSDDDQMVEAWQKKAQAEGFQLGGFYDYWSITQWSAGTPQAVPIQRVEKWINWGFPSINIETTHSLWAGMWQWIAGQRMGYNPKSIEELYTQYLNDNFGKAAAEARRLFNFWQEYKGHKIMYFPETIRLINAVAAAGNNAAIDDLKAFGIFLNMKFNYDANRTEENYRKLVDFMLRTRSRFITQPWATEVYYTPPVSQAYPFVNDPSKLPRIDEDSLDRSISLAFSKLVASLPAPYYSSSMNFDHQKVSFKDFADTMSWRFGRSARAYIYPTTANLEFAAGNGSEARLIVRKNGSLILDTKINKGNADFFRKPDADHQYYLKRFKLKVEPGVRYDIELQPGFNQFRLYTKDVLFMPNQPDAFDNYGFPIHYLYIPKDMRGKQLLFSDAIGKGVYFYAANVNASDKGKVFLAKPVDGRPGVFGVDVQNDWVGKTIKVGAPYPGIQMLNLPSVFALNNFDYKE